MKFKIGDKVWLRVGVVGVNIGTALRYNIPRADVIGTITGYRDGAYIILTDEPIYECVRRPDDLRLATELESVVFGDSK